MKGKPSWRPAPQPAAISAPVSRGIRQLVEALRKLDAIAASLDQMLGELQDGAQPTAEQLTEARRAIAELRVEIAAGQTQQ